VVGWVVGWGEIEIKAKLSPAKAGAWAELGKNLSAAANLSILRLTRIADDK
jgi:hypothetical protein